MRKRSISVSRLGLALAIAALPISAVAQAGEQACPVTPAPLSAELAGWTETTPIASGGRIEAGQAAEVTLLLTDDISYAALPERAPTATSRGAMLSFSVAEAGVYRVALGAGAWIDVVREGRLIASSAHGHGPPCSGIRKMVDFALEPGDYALQLSESAEPMLRVLLTRLP